jgi:hypothetical protein
MAQKMRIGLSKSSSVPEMTLDFDSFDEAAEAADIIGKGGIGRVEVNHAKGKAVIWCNYVTYVVIESVNPEEE